MTTGNLNRSTGWEFPLTSRPDRSIFRLRATNMNEHSSRSHAIFMITVESSEVKSFTSFRLFVNSIFSARRRTKGAHSRRKVEPRRFGRKRTSGENRRDGSFSEKSKRFVRIFFRRAIGSKRRRTSIYLYRRWATSFRHWSTGTAHIPYRDSKLTRLLQSEYLPRRSQRLN